MLELKKTYNGLHYLASKSKLTLQDGQIDLSDDYSAGKPDSLLVDELVATLKQSRCFKMEMHGLNSLRNIVSDWYFNNYSYRYDPETEVTVTNGPVQAFSTAISALVKEGDEVIIIEPCFYTYVPTIEANGGRPVYVPMKAPDFTIDWDAVQKVVSVRTKLIIITSPHPVTGSILTSSDLERLGKIVNGTKISILSDEVFEHILFEGYEHQSVARFPKLAERSVIISSFSKLFNNDCWQIGYCVAPARLASEFRKMNQLQIYEVNSPYQIALANYFQKNSSFGNNGMMYQKKRDILLSGLTKTKLSFKPSRGSYFQVFGYAAISDLKDTEFCQKLISDLGIVTTPLSVFFHDISDLRYFRVNFAKNDDDLYRVNELLKKLA